MRKVVVIGGGAGGMMAALYAAKGGAQVTLLERCEKLGRKVYITGKGRCNVTNDCTIDEFMQEVPRNPRFLYSALSCLSPQDMIRLLEDNGCPTVTQRGRRVFPATEKASDVTRTLEAMLRRLGVTLRFNTRVSQILAQDDRVTGVLTEDGREFAADAVILATGGLSYPGTGSTGDGYALAEQLGHTTTPRRASLSGVVTAVDWPAQLQGLALKNVTITLRRGKKVLYEELGEMLFTHFGVSGPIVLELSCHLPEDFAQAEVKLNLKPGLTAEQLDARLVRELDAQSRKQLRTAMGALLPARFAEIFPELCGVDGTKICGQITREEREAIARNLQALPLPVKGLRPIAEAIVTRGGVSVKEIIPATMESKLCSGLYFAGEVIDVDAHTGGYNLQIAWSTGALAGQSAAEDDAAMTY